MPNVAPVLKPGSFKLAPSSVQPKAFNASVNHAPASSFEGLLDDNASAASDRAAQAASHDDKTSTSRTKESSPPAKDGNNKPANSAESSSKTDDSGKPAGDKTNDASANGTDKDGNPVQAADGNKAGTEKTDKSKDASDDAKNTKDAQADAATTAAAQFANATTPAADPNAAAAAVVIPVTVSATPDPKATKTDAADAVTATEAANAVAATAVAQETNVAKATDTADTANKADATSTAGAKDAAKTVSATSTKTVKAAVVAPSSTEDDTDEAEAASVLATDAVTSDDDALAKQDKTKNTDANVVAGNQKVDTGKTQSASTADTAAKNNSPLSIAGKPAQPSASGETNTNQPTQDAQALGDAPAKTHGASPEAATPRADANQLNKVVNDAAPQNLTPPPQPTTGIVSPAATTANTAVAAQAPAVPLAGVPIAIANKASEGKNHFEIRLDPPELGRIEVHLDVDRDGRITSHVMADRNDTLDLLRRDSSGLERALQDAGLKTSDNGLQFSLRNHSNGQEQRQNGANTAHLVLQDESLPAADISTQIYGRIITPNGGLDIRV